MRTVDILHELQGVDSTLLAERRRLAEIIAQLKDRSPLETAQRALAEAKAAHDALQAERRDQELAVDTLRAKASEIEAKLYGGKVTSTKELGSLSDEAQMFRTRIGAREETLIGLYDRLETAEAARKAAQSELDDTERTIKARDEAFRAEGRALDQRVKALAAQREQVRGRVDARALADYDRIAQKSGTAVSELRMRTCQACRVSLPSTLEGRARGTEILHCPNCGRILFLRV